MEWNLNSILIQIFSGLVMAAFLGMILYIFWKIIGKMIEKCGYVDINYLIWKVIILSFIVPFSFVYIKRIEKTGRYGFVFYTTKEIVLITNFLVGLWAAVCLVKVIRFIYQYVKIYQAIKIEGEADQSIQNKIETIAKTIGIKRKVQAVVVKQLKVPMAYGVLKPKILLPKTFYNEEEIEVILFHELMHHKHRDLLWKFLENIVRCIYWFHPCLKDILYNTNQWRETYCDMEVSKYIDSMKKYFLIIMKIAVEEKTDHAYMVGLSEGTKLLVLRMQRMELYLKKKPLRKIVTTATGIGIILFSSVTVFASTKGFVSGYEWAAEKTADTEAEITIYKTDPEEAQRKVRVHQVKQITTKKQRLKPGLIKSVIWDVRSGRRIQTKKSYLEEGDTIDIVIGVETEDDHEERGVEIGILDDEGKKRYIEKKNGFNHVFKIRKSGYYWLYMENKSKREVTFFGAYSVHAKDEEE